MKKKYVSPLFAELEIELEDVLFDSAQDNVNDADDPDWNLDSDGDGTGDFDEEENFGF